MPQPHGLIRRGGRQRLSIEHRHVIDPVCVPLECCLRPQPSAVSAPPAPHQWFGSAAPGVLYAGAQQLKGAKGLTTVQLYVRSGCQPCIGIRMQWLTASR